jgi:hypothetical protein
MRALFDHVGAETLCVSRTAVEGGYLNVERIYRFPAYPLGLAPVPTGEAFLIFSSRSRAVALSRDAAVRPPSTTGIRLRPLRRIDARWLYPDVRMNPVLTPSIPLTLPGKWLWF